MLTCDFECLQIFQVESPEPRTKIEDLTDEEVDVVDVAEREQASPARLEKFFIRNEIFPTSTIKVLQEFQRSIFCHGYYFLRILLSKASSYPSNIQMSSFVSYNCMPSES